MLPFLGFIQYRINLIDDDDFSRDASEGFSLFPGSVSRIPRIRFKLRFLILKTTWIALALPIKAAAITSLVAAATTGIVFIHTLRPSYHQMHKDYSSEGIIVVNSKSNIITEQSAENEITTIPHQQSRQYNTFIFEPAHSEILPIRVITTNRVDAPDFNPGVLHYSSFPSVTFGQYKFYDFTSIYEKNNPLLLPTLTGLEAKFENRDAVRLYETMIFQDTVAYLDYMKKIALSMEKGQLKEALRLTDILLNQRPDDENGIYYKGLILYQLGRYETAFSYFHHCEHSVFRTFYHESRLHKLYLLNQKGNNIEALALIESMISEQSPFSEIAYQIKYEILNAQ